MNQPWTMGGQPGGGYGGEGGGGMDEDYVVSEGPGYGPSGGGQGEGGGNGRGYGGYSRDEGNARGGDGGYSMWGNSGISSGLDSNPYNTYGGRSDACAVSDPTPF